MDRIIIDPTAMRQFGDPEGATFVFVTNRSAADRFEVRLGRGGGGYAGDMTLFYEKGQSFSELLDQMPETAHILVISPDVYYKSPPAGTIGGRRKLLALACNSTPTDMDKLAHGIRMIEATDPAAQQELVDQFFATAEQSAFMEIVDPRYGTRARFDHMSDKYVWNEQAGFLGWGEQQLAPSGEVSALPLDVYDYSADLSLGIDGQMVIEGYPILHNGAPSYHPADQARIHSRLAAMQRGPMLATIERGHIVRLEALAPEAAPAVEMLERMFDVDSRYRIMWEFGFAVNCTLELYDANTAINELYGGQTGTIHIGLGLTPHTQYHLDIVCPATTILGDRGQHIFGPRAEEIIAGTAATGRAGSLVRIRSAACGCVAA
ncbi:hypothetical protein V6768_17025 [Tistrella mobilis]